MWLKLVKSLSTKGKDTSRRVKPMSLKAGVKNRYECGSKMKK